MFVSVDAWLIDMSGAGPVAKRLRCSAVATHSTPAAPPTHDAAQLVEDPHELMQRPGEMSLPFIDCVAIAHVHNAESLVENWLYKDDPVQLAHLEETLIGRWWKTCHNFRGPPLWRKETFGDSTDAPYMWHCPGKSGWVIGFDIVSPNDDNVIAWAPVPKNFEEFPQVIHLPYWCKKKNPMATCP